MRISFAEQFDRLDLVGLTITANPVLPTDLPCEEAVTQTLAGVWSDLFALFTDTALEADAEDLAWGFVNLFHRAATRKSENLDRATDEIRFLLAGADGSEIHTAELETQIERAQGSETSMLALEAMREVAAALYLNETGSSWRAVSSSRLNHGAMLTSAVVDGRQFLRSRAASKRRATMPEGTPVIFAGGRAQDSAGVRRGFRCSGDLSGLAAHHRH